MVLLLVRNLAQLTNTNHCTARADPVFFNRLTSDYKHELGMYHLGVVKTLFEHGLLPRIISGASVGALVAALVCVKTDDELPVSTLTISRVSSSHCLLYKNSYSDKIFVF